MDTPTQTIEKKPTKTQIAIDMFRCAEGATIKELSEALGWQKHTVRGFISGTIRKKLNLNLVKSKRKSGESSYFILDKNYAQDNSQCSE